MLTQRGLLLGMVAVMGLAAGARAGGSPENVLLIVNPASAESMYLADYYKNARNIPDANVMYLEPSGSYAIASGLNGDLDGLSGYLRNAGLTDHIDYIVVANTGTFFTSAPGLITDGCSPVTRLSQSSLFALANQRATILAGNLPFSTANQYFFPSAPEALAFSSNTGYAGGFVSSAGTAQHYYIGAQLGYTGTNGNTVAELLTMIDRAVGSDGTHPAGTFYFMSTTDPFRNVRANQFPAAVSAINSLGGNAVIQNNVLPDFTTDNLGIMTGWPDPPVDGSAIAPQPGSFCDHLTSYAATFDQPSQTKISSWIRRGAAGSAGTVEEPCNYTGKFTHANFHAIYFKGLSLGEAYFRSNQFLPFQNLLYGDPMTRPWATFPTIVSNAPTGTITGRVNFTPSASTTLPGAAIAGLSLFVDGVFQSTHTPGQQFTLNTGALSDGWHELRLLAWDNTPIRNTGRWVGAVNVNNLARTATLSMGGTSGDMTTLFSATVSGTGAPVQEVRLIQNGRVVAAAAGASAALSVNGRNLGAGQTRVQAEALFSDGRTARSAPTTINVSYAVGVPLASAPVAYSYTKRVERGWPFVVELPARFDDGLVGATYTIVTPPAQSSVGPGTRSTRVMRAAPNACGLDQFTFSVTTPSGQSNLATVTLVYGAGAACPADTSGDGQLNVIDFTFFINQFANGDLRADLDGSCQLNVQDFSAFLNAFAVGCP